MESMRILTDKDYNKRPNKKMTFSRLKKRKGQKYVLHFQCKELKTSYTVGINADLLVWGYQYSNGNLIGTYYERNIPTFKDAYKFFLDSCEHCLLEQKIINMTKNW